jgi:hypothetical protein
VEEAPGTEGRDCDRESVESPRGQSIVNELRYRITKEQVEKFEAVMIESVHKKCPNNLLHELEFRAIASQLRDLREQLRLLQLDGESHSEVAD